MKKFTVKDFLTYNAPCFSCNNPVNFEIGFIDLGYTSPGSAQQNWHLDSHLVSYLKPAVTANYTEIDLRITYTDCLKLYIFHKTNKILSSNQQGLTKYLSEHKLFLQTTCDLCDTQSCSQFLEFDLEKSVVKAVSVFSEKLVVYSPDTMYEIISSFNDSTSTFFYCKVDEKKVAQSVGHSMKLPLLPRHRFQNRQHFLDKMKTYVLFS
jgi:hypothetical protein